jgi:hypothetical protein
LGGKEAKSAKNGNWEQMVISSIVKDTNSESIYDR